MAELLERSEALARLDRDLDAVLETNAGRVWLISGEAGVGKTALVRAFRDAHHEHAQFLVGACDPLFTPRPLGPVLDVAEQVAGRLRTVAADSARPADVAVELLRVLASQPTVLVLEDLHWADEASLDVLGLVARRAESVPALVLATFRDDELSSTHAVRAVVGELVRQRSVDRLHLDRLSPVAVETLARPYGVDPHALHAVTGGNPFFVTEVLAAGDERVPATVREAVLARVQRLPPATRPVLEAVAIAPQGAEHWLLDVLAPHSTSLLDACLANGILVAGPTSVGFRHELARLAVEDSLPPPRRRELHVEALEVLSRTSDATVDAARLAHHARMAGDSDAVLRFAPAAAERAAALGAHREAAAHYALTLEHSGELTPSELAPLLIEAAREDALVGRLSESVSLYQRAASTFHDVERPVEEGDALRALVRPLWTLGRDDEALAYAEAAVRVLEPLPPTRELAQAYAILSFLHRKREDLPATTACAAHAVEIGEELGDPRAVAAALANVGALEFQRGDPAGRAKAERGIAVAAGADLVDEVAAGQLALAYAAVTVRAHAQAARYIADALQHCDRYQLDGWRPFAVALRAEQQLELGEWDSAGETAELVLRARGAGLSTAFALVTVVRLRARRGDPDPWRPADMALEFAERSDIGRLGRVAAARAELAWLEGHAEQAVAETDRAWEMAQAAGNEWIRGELAVWRRRAGVPDEPSREVAKPYALALAGEWRAAHAMWTNLGCPYEAALMAAEGDDAHCRSALDALHALGARGTAAIVAHRLRERGAHGLPRGPRPSTAGNPAHLTSREVEVLGLVAEGLRNADIAKRLFISSRTVEHHVSAILRKLNLDSRAQAAAAAARLGLSPR